MERRRAIYIYMHCSTSVLIGEQITLVFDTDSYHTLLRMARNKATLIDQMYQYTSTFY